MGFYQNRKRYSHSVAAWRLCARNCKLTSLTRGLAMSFGMSGVSISSDPYASVLGRTRRLEFCDATDRRNGCVKRTGDNKSSLAAKTWLGGFSRRVPAAPDSRRCPGAAREVVNQQQDPQLRFYHQGDLGQWAVVGRR